MSVDPITGQLNTVGAGASRAWSYILCLSFSSLSSNDPSSSAPKLAYQKVSRELGAGQGPSLQLVVKKKVARPGSSVRLTVSSAPYDFWVHHLTLLADPDIVYESKIISRADWMKWGAVNLKVMGACIKRHCFSVV